MPPPPQVCRKEIGCARWDQYLLSVKLLVPLLTTFIDVAFCSLFSCLFLVLFDWPRSISSRDTTVGLAQSSHVQILVRACLIMKRSTSTGKALIPNQTKIGQDVHVVPSLAFGDMHHPWSSFRYLYFIDSLLCFPSFFLSLPTCPSIFFH